MSGVDEQIGAYTHLDKLDRAADALHTLKKIASLVKPIMRARGWRVGTLSEFYPDQQNLLGKLNNTSNMSNTYIPRTQCEQRPESLNTITICGRQEPVHAHGASSRYDASRAMS